MSIQLYDEALLNKLRNWTQDVSIHVVGVDESSRLFAATADSNNDAPLSLPLIALTRPGGFTIMDKYKQPKSYSGTKVAYSDSRGALLNAIHISIPYQIDVYTRYQYEADEYIRNIVFNIINYPKLTIEIPYYDLGLHHDSNIRLDTDVEDNSSIPERLVPGQFKRYTVGIVIDDAYLFDVRIKDNVKIVEIATEGRGTSQFGEKTKLTQD